MKPELNITAPTKEDLNRAVTRKLIDLEDYLYKNGFCEFNFIWSAGDGEYFILNPNPNPYEQER